MIPFVRKGLKVRMTAKFKAKMREHSPEHIKEFGNCVGIIGDYVDYNGKTYDEFNVYWQPSKLRYAYFKEDLELA